MNWTDFTIWSQRFADWAGTYRRDIRARSVRAPLDPGRVRDQLPQKPPQHGEDMDRIFADFERIIMPGITHWQHPRFFAYFNSNAAAPSVLAEQLIAALGVNAMLWQTSPAATELESCVIDWLRQALGLPDPFDGVIQDSASTATLAAILTMRERALAFQGNMTGLHAQPRLRIYCSQEVHSSIDKAVWIAGIGQDNLVKIPHANDSLRGIDLGLLHETIKADLAAGYLPAGLIGCVGGTSAGACDKIAELMDFAEDFDLYTHIDAAWAGSAMICEEFRHLWKGVARADSVVFNPHKWLGANFDCAVQFLRDPSDQIKTLAIQPDYLKTQSETKPRNYSEWSLPLGRRFRALKLWFLIRAYGIQGLQDMIRNHVSWVQKLAERIDAQPDFELMTTPVLAMFTFRHLGYRNLDDGNLDLLERINNDGRIYLTQTKIDGETAIRFAGCQFDATSHDIDTAFDVICDIARQP